MFFLPGSNAYSLKLILPANFNATGGTYVDYLQDELTSHKTQADYTIRGYFTSPAEQACFRVLRGPKEAGSQGVFELRHELCLSVTQNEGLARQGTVAPCPGTGGITYERWDNITGTTLADLTSKTNNFQLPPSLVATLTSFEGPTNIADNYGARIRGYICPPTTGIYYFWIAGDDNVSLQLNTNGIEASAATQIAVNNGWTDSRVWTKYSEQKSVGIMLTAGQRYYVEALMKEGEVGDNVAVGWAKPGEATDQPSEVIPGQYLLPISQPSPVPMGTDVVAGGKCYSIQNLQSLKYAQRQDDNTVTMTDRDATNASQVWKAEAINGQFKFSSQSIAKMDLVYVNAFQDGQLLRVGSTVDDERYRWTLAPSSNGGYRIYGGPNQSTWDQANTGQSNGLQLFGSNTNQIDQHWDKPYRRFSFTEVGCQATASSCNLVAVASPASIVAGATSTLTVSGGGNTASYVWKAGGSQVGTGSSLSVQPPATTTYQVECSSCGGCGAGQATVSVSPAQSQTANLTVSPGSASVVVGGGSAVFAVTANVAWSLSGLPTWLSASSTTGSGNGGFTLTAAANTASTSRTASVVVSGGGLSQSITLTQVGVTSTPPPASGDCYVISNRQTNQYLQAQASNVVEHVALATGQAGQIWKFEALDGKLRISTTDGSGRVLYVEAYRNDQPVRLGADLAGEPRYRWVKELIPGTAASYRVRSDDLPWVQQYAGGGPALQIWGSAARPLDQVPNYGQYVFQSVGCQATASSCNLVAVASPANIVAGATSTLTVSGGGNTASYVWKAGGSQVGTGSSLSVQPPATTTYQVECSSCGGCGAGQATVSVSPAQSQTANLTVSPSQVSWPNTASSQLVTVSSNVAWSLSGLPTWLSASSTTGSGNGGFTLTAAANTASTSRTASVVVSGGGLSQSITLTQVGVTSTPPPASGDCYVISNRQTNQYLQAQASNVVEHVALATGQAGQIWKFEALDGKLRISTTDGSGRVLYVEAYRNDQPVRLGADLAGEPRYRWVKELIPGTAASYRVRSDDLPWVQQYAGGGPALQIWGSAARPLDQVPNYGQYVFQSVGCQATASSCNLVAVASPASLVAGATSTLTVSGGGNTASYVWKAGGSQVGTGSSLSVQPPATTTYQVECSSCGGCGAGQATVSVSPAQSQTANLTVSPGSASVVVGGGSAVFAVTANVAWSLSGLPAWLSASSTTGSGNGGFTLTASANTGTSRSATITVNGGTVSQTILLTQSGVAANGAQPVYNLATMRLVGVQSARQSVPSDPLGRQYLDAAVEAGVDYIQVLADWGSIDNGDGTYNWNLLEGPLNYALSKGIKSSVRISLLGDLAQNRVWFPAAGAMVDNYGHTHYGGDGVCFSLNHQPSLEAAQKFVTALATRLNANPALRDNIITMSVCQSDLLETNYPASNRIDYPTNNHMQDVEFDHSSYSYDKFRERLRGWCGNDLARYNRIPGVTTVTSWSQIVPATQLKSAPPTGYPSALQKLWYYHRHLSIYEFLDRMLGAIHTVNPIWNLMAEFSTMQTELSRMGANAGAHLLVPPYVKGTKTNPASGMDFNLMANLSFGDRAADKFISQECGANSQTQAQNVDNGVKFFASDGNLFFIAQPMRSGDINDVEAKNEGIAELKGIIRDVKASPEFKRTLLRKAPVNPNNPVRLSLKLGIEKSYQDGVFSQNYYAIDGSAQGGYGTNAVIVELIDDILSVIPQ